MINKKRTSAIKNKKIINIIIRNKITYDVPVLILTLFLSITKPHFLFLSANSRQLKYFLL